MARLFHYGPGKIFGLDKIYPAYNTRKSPNCRGEIVFEIFLSTIACGNEFRHVRCRPSLNA